MNQKLNRIILLSVVLIVLTYACGSPPVAKLEVTVSPTSNPTLTSSPTATSSPLPAQATLTEYARQAEGTRQVLVETQVALEQNANATATSRALDATAAAL